jgi:hypothetical protein
VSDKIRVRIVNDGKPGYMTKVTDVETGQAIDRLKTIYVHIDAEKETTASLVVYSPVVDLIVDAEILHICPCCGREAENDK